MDFGSLVKKVTYRFLISLSRKYGRLKATNFRKKLLKVRVAAPRELRGSLNKVTI
jgi:hypothetical protein